MTRNDEVRTELPGMDTAALAAPLGPTGRPLRAFPAPAELTQHGPAKIVALCNQKGGVGKTTTSINLGAALAEYGRRVLAIDFDPQGALSAGLGAQTHDVTTIYDLLLNRHADVQEAIQSTGVAGLDIIPANIDLSAAEVHLVNEVAREQILAGVLRKVSADYDVILIDCQPYPARVRVLRAARRRPPHRDHRQGARAAQPGHRARRHPRHDVRLPHAAFAGGAGARRRRLR